MSAVLEADDVDELKAEIADLRSQVASLESDLGDQDSTIAELRKKIPDDDFEDAIDGVLDLVERPVGKLDCSLPHTAESSRALLRLFDAIGRSL